jgi:hypothetical protein
MDPFTIALATFGIQKLRGKSTNRALRDAALAGGIGQFAGMAGVGPFQAFGSTSIPGMTGSFVGGPAAGAMGPIPSVGQQVAMAPQNTMSGIKNLIGSKAMTPEQVKAAGLSGDAATKAMQGSGFMGLSPGAQLGIGLGASTLLAGEEEAPEMPAGTRPEDYKAAQEKADKQLEGILESYDYGTTNTPDDIYNYTNRANSMYAFSKGGIAEVRKFNQGGVNYLPSKFDHDEKDYNNYVRAEGYVEDGTGNGDKDTDTILAQLADGEFVSRADAILGAGILEGANPASMKDMRKKGAAFFYGQQAKFKRIFNLLDAARKEAN